LSGLAKEVMMELAYAMGGVVSLALFIYLLFALFKPEMFE
jgi:K+-transporting ATPase KdpF subunit